MLLSHYEKYSFTTGLWSMLGIDAHNNLFKTVITHPFVAYQDSDYSNLRKNYRNRRKTFKNAENRLGTTRKRYSQ